ncbi:MAG: enoyl-CoA hydratase-related protein [SAR324 cluster bacterium]|nr:enoyl-CoA hydratase-related protein [SAR324 cluster bacterium]
MNYDYRTLKLERKGRLLTLSMNRPDKLNAVDAVMHEELSRVFSDINLDDGADVVILTGEGRGFSAGGDMAWQQAMIDDAAIWAGIAREGKKIVTSLLDLEKPIIAKVNGAATGLGATLALYCDVIFASDKALIGDTHVLAGLVAGDGGTAIWPQLIGYARAKEYLMTGELIPGPKAAEIGLVNHCVPHDELDAAVDAFAERLLSGATQAIRYTKMAVNATLKQIVAANLETSIALEELSNALPDHQEAVSAFQAKRKPNFRGK